LIGGISLVLATSFFEIVLQLSKLFGVATASEVAWCHCAGVEPEVAVQVPDPMKKHPAEESPSERSHAERGIRNLDDDVVSSADGDLQESLTIKKSMYVLSLTQS